MLRLSKDAVRMLGRMDAERDYGADDVRALAPEISVEHLREVMHELWVSRQVERVGYSGWRRQGAGPPSTPESRPQPVATVRPEELFDHAAFEDFFK
jgi:hypothetical protein